MFGLQLFTPPVGHLIFCDLVLSYQKQMPVEFLERDMDIFLSLRHTKPNTLIINGPGNFIRHTYSPIVVMTNKDSFIHSSIQQIFIECLLKFGQYFRFGGLSETETQEETYPSLI